MHKNIVGVANLFVVRLIFTEQFLNKSFDWFKSDVIQWNDPLDSSRSSRNFNMHTDWLYYKDVPEIIWLYCVDPWDSLATTYLIDTTKVIDELSDREIEVLKMLEYTYIGRDNKTHSRPALEVDPLSKKLITNISAKWFISPYKHLWALMPDLFEYTQLISDINKRLKSTITYTHNWSKWDLLLINNNRYLHWRNWEKTDTKRHLLRFRINVDKTHLKY